MCVLNMKFLASIVQNFSLNRYIDTQTDSTEIMTYPHTRMVTTASIGGLKSNSIMERPLLKFPLYFPVSFSETCPQV